GLNGDGAAAAGITLDQDALAAPAGAAASGCAVALGGTASRGAGHEPGPRPGGAPPAGAAGPGTALHPRADAHGRSDGSGLRRAARAGRHGRPSPAVHPARHAPRPGRQPGRITAAAGRPAARSPADGGAHRFAHLAGAHAGRGGRPAAAAAARRALRDGEGRHAGAAYHLARLDGAGGHRRARSGRLRDDPAHRADRRMSLLLAASAVCLAFAITATLLLVQRRLIRSARGGEPAPRAPVLLRLVTPLALLLEPTVDCCLTARRRAALVSRLEALGFGAAFTPQRWESRCIALALVAGGLVPALMPGAAWLALPGAVAGYLHGGLWLRQQRELQQQAIARELPAWLDLMIVCVEAGSTLTAGIRLIVEQAPPGPLRDFFDRVLREIRGGRSRAQAF